MARPRGFKTREQAIPHSIEKVFPWRLKLRLTGPAIYGKTSIVEVDGFPFSPVYVEKVPATRGPFAFPLFQSRRESPDAENIGGTQVNGALTIYALRWRDMQSNKRRKRTRAEQKARRLKHRGICDLSLPYTARDDATIAAIDDDLRQDVAAMMAVAARAAEAIRSRSPD
jgi:hypothetical protein